MNICIAAIITLCPLTPAPTFTYGCATVTADNAAECLAKRLNKLPACEYEDGNPDGSPCLWADPDTGRVFYNDGSNYRG